MTNEITILSLTQMIILVLAIILALIYSSSILLIRRFHNVNNIFTVNLCFATICCCTYWLFYIIVYKFYPEILAGDQVCVALNYFEMLCTIQVPLAVVEVSVHRLCSVVYHTKLFFKKKQWAVICIASHWTIGILVALPRITINDPFCGQEEWRKVYTLLMIVIIPSSIYSINNIIIFNYVRSSTNRIQPSSGIPQNQCTNRRDLHLLRHMIIMFSMFVGGWSPIYLYTTISISFDFTSTIVSLLILLAELSLLFDIINLFLYNHELRRYIQDQIFNRRPIQNRFHFTH